MKILLKIDRYKAVLVGFLFALALLVGLTIRNTFTQFNRSQDIKDEDLITGAVRINRQTLDESLEYITNRKTILLDLK